MISYTKTELHPLIKYIRNWEAFNAAPRKTYYRNLGKMVIACIAFNVLLHLFIS